MDNKPPQSQQETPGRAAGIDYGEVRIGIALSDPERIIASPFETYTRRNEVKDAEYFRRLVETHGITLFVVGLPIHCDGQESQRSQATRRFAKWLEETTGVPVTFFDERFTTRYARILLSDAAVPRRKRKARIDKLAAQILLHAFLENPQGANWQPDPLDDPPDDDGDDEPGSESSAS
ncbi:Holliday junction resolvase RuvX [Thermostilla marina]